MCQGRSFVSSCWMLVLVLVLLRLHLRLQLRLHLRLLFLPPSETQFIFDRP